MYDWSFTYKADEMNPKKQMETKVILANSENGFTEDSSDDAKHEMVLELKMLPPKSRSPGQGPSRAAEGAVDASPGSSSRLVSHAGSGGIRERREQNMFPQTSKHNDSRNTSSPLLPVVDIQFKLKEELDKELGIKRVAGDQNAANYMNLPPKSRSPSRTTAAEGADDSSPGSSSRLVSHAESGIRERREQNMSPQTTEHNDSQNTSSPLVQGVLKLKEELDKELQIKKGMKLKAGGGGDEAE